MKSIVAIYKNQSEEKYLYWINYRIPLHNTDTDLHKHKKKTN